MQPPSIQLGDYIPSAQELWVDEDYDPEKLRRALDDYKTLSEELPLPSTTRLRVLHPPSISLDLNTFTTLKPTVEQHPRKGPCISTFIKFI